MHHVSASQSSLSNRLTFGCAIFAILVGAALRAFNLTHGISFHPDERHIVMVAERLSWSDLNPDFFAYGSFPFYLLWSLSELIGVISEYYTRYDGLFVVGRVISVIFGVAGGVLTYFLASAVYGGRRVPLLAAVLLLLNVFHIQLSRFYAFDGVLSTLNLAALLCMLRIPCAAPPIRAFVLSGIFLGLSVATKISALSLLIPFAVAVVLHLQEQNRWLSLHSFAKCAIFLLTAVATFVIAEPYAILDWHTFLAQNREQINMVQGLWRPPYTVQYAETTPYLYPLVQMFHYTIGEPVGILVLLGTIAALARQMRAINNREIMLLAWALPTFFVIAGYQVKFPRYLLPIYPILLIFASRMWHDLMNVLRAVLPVRRWIPSLVTALLVGWCLLRAVAFVSIYSSEHVYFTASRWIFSNIPAGSQLLEPHWDDTLPLHLPGLDPARYRREHADMELAIYEPDTPAKLEKMSAQLAKADYLVFTTPRVPGSITRLPDEFVYSDPLLKLLFAGQLGYSLEASFKEEPRFGPLRIDDDIADESFSVYDHPKVVIFRNEDRLSALEIQSRIKHPHHYGPLPTREDILRAGTPHTHSVARDTPPSLVALMGWIVLLELLSLSILPLCYLLFRRFPDRGLGLSKAGAVLLFGYLAWVLPSLGFAIPSRAALFCIVLAMAAVSTMVLPRLGGVPALRPLLTRPIIVGELLFLSGLLVFAVLRACNPEIFWGEKPMDFSFLNYFLRAQSLPPEDPWVAGRTMRYYYLGSYLCAMLTKLSGLPSALSYNLLIATIPALCLAGFYSILLLLWRTPWIALLGSCTAVLASNPEIVRLVTVGQREFNFATFWDSTRLFTPPAFTEYPLWSFLFADLHAHVINLPFCVFLLGITVATLHGPRAISHQGAPFFARIVWGMTLGLFIPLNTWDFLTYGFFTVVVMSVFHLRDPNPQRSLVARAKLLALDLSLIGASALVAVLPYLATSNPQSGASWGWAHSFEFNTLEQQIRHFGFWLVLLVVIIICYLAHRIWRARKIGFARLLLSLLLALYPIGLTLACVAREMPQQPWGVAVASSILLFSASIGLLLAPARNPTARVGFSSIIALGLLLPTIEVFFLIDRMNTIFKFYHSLWFIFALASLSMAPTLLKRKVRTRSPASFLYTLSIRTFLLILLGVSFLGSVVNSVIISTFHRVEGPRPTLDGGAYLSRQDDSEHQLIKWINSSIIGTPALLEAQGDSYGPYTRIAMHTGLPSMLGWEHHVKQRGTHEKEVSQRARDIRIIYSTPNPSFAESLLRKYQVKLIVVSSLERRMYPPAGLAKFEENPELYQPLFKVGESALYVRMEELRGEQGLRIAWE